MSGVRGWVRGHPHAADVVPAALAVAVALTVHDPRDPLRSTPQVTSSSLAVVCIVLAGAVLIGRRDRPLPAWAVSFGLCLAAGIAAGGSALAVFPALVAVYTVATRCAFRTVAVVAVVTALLPTLAAVPATDGPAGAVLFLLVAWVATATAAGLAVRNQRAVVGAARQRAVEAERTADEHAQRRVAEERLRIARELHDVVAHHVAVITVQAGVARHLLPTDPTAATVALDHVREASQLILQEIPTLLGVLRTDEDDSPTAPTPRLAEVADLVEAARNAGLAVRSRQRGAPVELDAITDLAAYRVVQEALTNAAKHGDGEAEVSIANAAERVVVEVRNRPAASSSGSTPGHGLIGMRERVTAAGGELEVGRSGAEWVVRAALPVTRPAAPDGAADARVDEAARP